MSIEMLWRAECDNCGACMTDGVEETFSDYDLLKGYLDQDGWVEDDYGLWCPECKGLPFEEAEDV